MRDGGSLARRKARVLTPTHQLAWSSLEHGNRTKLFKANGSSQMVIATQGNLAITNQMEKEYGRCPAEIIYKAVTSRQ